MNFINKVTNKDKVLNLKLILDRMWRTKSAPKPSLKYLKDRTWKIKQYLNYILMIINNYILAILRTFLNLQKKNCEILYTNQTSTAANNFLAKLITDRKYLINTLDLCEAEISVHEIIKSINSERNN